MKTVKAALIKLIDVKSIITISCTVVFLCLAIQGRLEENQEFVGLYMLIVGWYFGRKTAKDEGTGTEMKEGEEQC